MEGTDRTSQPPDTSYPDTKPAANGLSDTGLSSSWVNIPEPEGFPEHLLPDSPPPDVPPPSYPAADVEPEPDVPPPSTQPEPVGYDKDGFTTVELDGELSQTSIWIKTRGIWTKISDAPFDMQNFLC